MSACAGAEDEGRALKHLLAGGIAAIISKTLTAPADRFSKLQQVNSRKFVSLRHVWKTVAREGTICAYFKGNTITVLKCTPENAVKMALNDHLKGLLAKNPTDMRPHERIACGGLAGMVSQAMMYPLEVVRTRMALAKAGTYNGIAHLVSKVAHNEGHLAFWRGLGCATVRPYLACHVGVFPYAGIDIAVFESTKLWLQRIYNGEAPSFAVFSAGVMSSTAAQLSCYPLAVILTRLQVQGMEGSPVRYKGVSDALRKIVKREGWAGLYKGCLPNTLRIAPAAGISWLVYERVKQQLGMSVWH